jgi:hypothetical protein
MEASKLKDILEQHKLWIDGKGGKRADLTGANLRGADLTGANLHGAKFSDADLSGADLTDANLHDANLRYADLTGANLRYADLTGADLRGANLRGANLTGANLPGANLKVANLKDANLGGADLTGANLHCADFYNTILPDISWIIPRCLAQLNEVKYGFYLVKENKFENFIQDSLGFFIQNNPIEKTFDILVGDRIIRNIPDWVKYSGMKQVAAVII